MTVTTYDGMYTRRKMKAGGEHGCRWKMKTDDNHKKGPMSANITPPAIICFMTISNPKRILHHRLPASSSGVSPLEINNQWTSTA
ncbi:hypothetical protein E3N88_23161 [Mikania micrantha]|uniref:Uncharacterized protein n=1 Tax=Mikania micrantha TaxID=192012 RepID=A0A5N6NE93_9ASTR|nr:hypothetical protein E3N88_23161 [Mikania micrantha]